MSRTLWRLVAGRRQNTLFCIWSSGAGKAPPQPGSEPGERALPANGHRKRMRTFLHVQTIWDFAFPPPHPLNDTRVVA